MKKISTKNIIIISILSALSFILMLINFPLPFFPPFLKIDIADIPAYIGFILFGGGVGSIIIVLKIILYTIIAASEPIGPLGNLLASFSFLLPIYLVYRRHKTLKSLVLGILIGTISMTIILSLLNYFVLLPLYGIIIDQRAIIENVKILVTAGIIPFNLVKGVIVGIVIYLVHLKIIPVLKNITEKNTRL